MMSPSLTTRRQALVSASPPPLGPFITFGAPVLARLFSITPPVVNTPLPDVMTYTSGVKS